VTHSRRTIRDARKFWRLFVILIGMIDAKNVHGAVIHENSGRKDSLFRVTLKAVILNKQGQVLVVKERGRDWWDIPGGGIEHGETVKQALARELKEEVSLLSDFEFEVLLAEDPHYLEGINVYQMRITFIVKPGVMKFEAGEDGDEVQFIDANRYQKSELFTERQIFKFSMLAKKKLSSPHTIDG
jgi:ADP-ribose pyrophosphatase YjhB (NUDIX family)